MADIGTVDRQISLPFSFGPDGTVQSTIDLVKQLADHVTGAVGTQQGERAMASTYGTDIMPFLFGPVDDLVDQEITSQISSSLGTNVPEVAFQSLDITADPGNGTLMVNVNYALGADEGTTSTTSVPVQIGN